MAVGNVRRFDEVQAKTRALTESLQQQTATADVLKVISRSVFDLQAVLDALVESAAHLCDTDRAVLTRKQAASSAMPMMPWCASRMVTSFKLGRITARYQ